MSIGEGTGARYNCIKLKIQVISSYSCAVPPVLRGSRLTCALQHTCTHCNILQHSETLYNLYQTLQHALGAILLCCLRIFGEVRLQVRCNTLQHVATRCDTLWYTATHCNTKQRTATHCDILRYSTVHCTTLQNIVAHCSQLHHAAPRCTTQQYTAIRYNTLQHTATHCNTLQHTWGPGSYFDISKRGGHVRRMKTHRYALCGCFDGLDWGRSLIGNQRLCCSRLSFLDTVEGGAAVCCSVLQ